MEEEQRRDARKLEDKALMWMTMVFLLSAFILLAPAGTIFWVAGLTFLGFFWTFVTFLTYFLLRRNPGLLAERLTILKSDQPIWDRVWLISFYMLSLFWFAVMPLDAVRWHWSHMPLLLQTSGGLFFLYALAGIFVSVDTNSFLSPVVRIQPERGHVVISSGLYSKVRHPFYASACLFYLSVPALLGSWVGMACAPLFIGLLVYRSIQEECWLRDNLPGYVAYMELVRRRFIPGVW